MWLCRGEGRGQEGTVGGRDRGEAGRGCGMRTDQSGRGDGQTLAYVWDGTKEFDGTRAERL